MSYLLRPVFLAGFAIIYMGAFTPVLAQDYLPQDQGAQNHEVQAQVTQHAISNRLSHMDRQIQTLSHAVFKKGILPNKSKEDYKARTVQYSNTSEMEVRLSQLEREIRALTGRIETQAHEISQLENKFQRRISDLELRIQDMEKRGRGPGTSPGGATNGQEPLGSDRSPVSTGQQAGDTPSDVVSELSRQGNQAPSGQNTLGTLGGQSAQQRRLPIEQYEQAFATLKQGEYDKAEKQFRGFIQDNPEHRLISNARYWLGETFYVREDYEQAARAFAKGYKENPSGAKAPDNLLKLGLSLNGLGNREDACVALIQLTQKFEDGPRPVLNRASQEIERLDCAR